MASNDQPWKSRMERLEQRCGAIEQRVANVENTSADKDVIKAQVIEELGPLVDKDAIKAQIIEELGPRVNEAISAVKAQVIEELGPHVDEVISALIDAKDLSSDVEERIRKVFEDYDSRLSVYNSNLELIVSSINSWAAAVNNTSSRVNSFIGSFDSYMERLATSVAAANSVIASQGELIAAMEKQAEDIAKTDSQWMQESGHRNELLAAKIAELDKSANTLNSLIVETQNAIKSMYDTVITLSDAKATAAAGAATLIAAADKAEEMASKLRSIVRSANITQQSIDEANDYVKEITQAILLNQRDSLSLQKKANNIQLASSIAACASASLLAVNTVRDLSRPPERKALR